MEREREKERERERIVDRDFEEARQNYSTPDRFRYLMKEAPDPPLRWPWFVGTLNYVKSIYNFTWLIM